MAYVVTENCIRCRYQDCVEVCPVDCFHAGPHMLVINPDECIDCSLCEPECPADAIAADDRLPPGQAPFIRLNRELAAQWPVLTARGPAPPDADEWLNVEGKLSFLETESPGPVY